MGKLEIVQSVVEVVKNVVETVALLVGVDIEEEEDE